MKKVSAEDFWNAVADSSEEPEIAAMFSEEPADGTPDEIISFVKDRYVPAMIKAVEINGCSCAQTSVKNFLDELVAAFEQRFQGPATENEVNTYMNALVVTKASEYARDKKCHLPVENPLNCYCDEHDH